MFHLSIKVLLYILIDFICLVLLLLTDFQKFWLISFALFIYLNCRRPNEQKNADSVKAACSAGQEEDEYGGSTDEEPEEVQSTPATILPSQGKISLSRSL